MENETKALPKGREHLLMSSLFNEVKVEIQQEDRETAKRIIKARLREIAQAEKTLLTLRKELEILMEMDIADAIKNKGIIIPPLSQSITNTAGPHWTNRTVYDDD